MSSVENIIEVAQEAVQKTPANAQDDKGFSNFVRHGEIETKGLSDGNTYVASNYIYDIINASSAELSVMRALSNVNKITSDSLDVVVDSDHLMAASWTDEAGLSNVVVRNNIKSYELFSQPKITQKLIDDSAVNVEEIVARQIGENFARKENNAFLHGDGNQKPTGLLTHENGTGVNQIEQIVGGLDYASVANLIASLDAFYKSGAALLLNPATEQLLRNIQDNNGQYIYSPASGNVPAKVLGVNIVTTSDMPDSSSGNLAIVYANFKHAYQVVDSGNPVSIRDPFTEKPFVKFYTTKRVGGALLDGRAAKILKIS